MPQSQTVIAIGISVVGAIFGGLAAGVISEGQLDLEWQLSGAVGAALGALLILFWFRPFSR